ncbi:MAG: selenium metabolism-associated LysR family transcriptional regulator [Thermodesulfovibrionales bacterium]|nr:LysR family transcriptional regulator [Nitrospinota bacterium]MCG2709699.1 LysR family transcriptional regulator [Thermodesulfovibrionales bacterium]MCG2813087.1 LysR family transcriptional regulator [Thermodesulfovibrionales bacterium]MDP3047975.1 selenium metabolism-associated LysR family transcriptional regulator [Thermodesulfovibrionales bacterium]
MEDHKLKVFCTVAETKSFSKASEIIHLTQPAVSLLVQAIEEIYEIKLFDRASNTVTLTPAGEMLYKYAKEILNLYAAAEKNIGEITGFVKGSIRVGASSTIGNYLLPGVIADFRKTYPKIKVHLLVGNTKRVVELLNAGNIDIGLVEGDVARQKMVVDKLVTDELALIVPPLHPLAKKRNISIFEITKEPFIFREEGSGTRQVIEKYLGKYSITPQNMMISMVLGSTEAIKESVENGMGIAIVSRWAVRKEIKYGTLKPLSFKEEKMLRDFSLIFQKKAISSHAVDEFLSYLKAYTFDNLLSLSE